MTAVISSGECSRGRERPQARSTAPLGARAPASLPRAGLEGQPWQVQVRAQRVGTRPSSPGPASALPRLPARHAGFRTPGGGGGGGGRARRLGVSGAAGASGGGGGGGSSPVPRTRARYSLTARSRAPAAVNPNPGYLSAGRAQLGAGRGGGPRLRSWGVVLREFPNKCGARLCAGPGVG